MKRRAAARGWVTRQAGTLEVLAGEREPPVTIVELTDAIDTFNKRLATLDDVQAEMEAELDMDKLEQLQRRIIKWFPW